MTPQEILDRTPLYSSGDPHYSIEETLFAMKEYAAQEVKNALEAAAKSATLRAEDVYNKYEINKETNIHYYYVHDTEYAVTIQKDSILNAYKIKY